jgi:transposase
VHVPLPAARVTHAGTHVAAALDPLGGLLGVGEFPATAARYADLLGWLAGFGPVALAGVEGTGSYGAGLARYLAAAGIRVVEVDRPDRQDRRRAGKSDPLDAVSAARAALSGRAAGAPKGRDGAVEAIRALMVAKRSARHERTQAINQARALIVTGPDELRARFAQCSAAQLVACLAALRPRPGEVPGYATRVALRELGRRARFPGAQIEHLDELIVALVTARAPGLLALYGVGADTAGVSGGARVFVDQAAQDGFSVDPSAVEVGNGEVATVVLAVGDALGDSLVRPGRVVVHLIFGQDGAQVALAEDQHAVEELSAQGADEPLADRVHARRLDGGAQDPGAGGLEDGVEHQQLSILRQVTAEHQDGQAEYPARKQVDDLEQHPAS